MKSKIAERIIKETPQGIKHYVEMRANNDISWEKIKEYKQQYKRLIDQKKSIVSQMSDVSSLIQKELIKINKEGEKYEQRMFLNNQNTKKKDN